MRQDHPSDGDIIAGYGDSIALLDSSTQVGSGSVLANGTWSATTDTSVLGSHTLTAMQSDPYGETAIASAPFTLVIDPILVAVSRLTLRSLSNSGLAGDHLSKRDHAHR